MRILALEPYYGGSHKAFLDGWIGRSCHEWTLLSLKDSKWKWRMRHAAITFAGQVAELVAQGQRWDLVFCTDMLNLAEFLGLAPPSMRDLPTLVYFHENQITYPVREESERDYHFVFSNMITALAADRVWFNSQFHCDEFLEGLSKFLNKMPDNRPLEELASIREKCAVRMPGIEDVGCGDEGLKSGKGTGALHILWVARWELDKRPDRFFEAMELLDDEGVDFRLSVIGGWGGRAAPECFAMAEKRFKERIVHWGYQPSRESYLTALSDADVVVSTADHEFFGIGVVEAVAAGAYPVVPNRLAYPEVLKEIGLQENGAIFYEGEAKALAKRLIDVEGDHQGAGIWRGNPAAGKEAMSRYLWSRVVPLWDEELACAVADK